MRRLHRRSARVAERRFVVEGPQAVRAALAAASLLELFVLDAQAELALAAAAAGVPVVTVSGPVLEALAETVTPQGLVGVAGLLDVPLADALARRPRLVAVLHEVADPGNAGTMIRTADAAGAGAVVLTAGSVDPHGGKCVRASAGSLWQVPIVSGPSLELSLDALRAAGLQILATSGTGEDDLEELADADGLAAPTAWLFSTEAHGLPPSALAAADRRVRISLRGGAESLNVAAAAAVCLFASARATRALQ